VLPYTYMTTIILLSLAGVVISLIVGTVWYMPSTPMGRLHMRYLGFDKFSPEEQKRKMEEAKPMMWKLYGGQMLLSLLTSFAVVFIITMSVQNGLTFPAALGFIAFNWLAFMVPIVGGHIIWGNVDRAIAWKKFFADALYHLVTIVLVALFTSLFV
jgi:hypothetical protein